jgi:membrane protease YdiL (CAAX protease family)
LAAFAGFHFRQGLAGIFLALVLGGIITGYYLWKRDLVATIFAHFLVDFVPNVLLPALGGAN